MTLADIIKSASGIQLSRESARDGLTARFMSDAERFATMASCFIRVRIKPGAMTSLGEWPTNGRSEGEKFDLYVCLDRDMRFVWMLLPLDRAMSPQVLTIDDPDGLREVEWAVIETSRARRPSTAGQSPQTTADAADAAPCGSETPCPENTESCAKCATREAHRRRRRNWL